MHNQLLPSDAKYQNVILWELTTACLTCGPLQGRMYDYDHPTRIDSTKYWHSSAGQIVALACSRK